MPAQVMDNLVIPTTRIPIFNVDLHYQSTNIGSKNKIEPFYG